MQAQIHHSVDSMDFVIEAQERISLVAVFRILICLTSLGGAQVPRRH
jgi:hypothetical protein